MHASIITILEELYSSYLRNNIEYGNLIMCQHHRHASKTLFRFCDLHKIIANWSCYIHFCSVQSKLSPILNGSPCVSIPTRSYDLSACLMCLILNLFSTIWLRIHLNGSHISISFQVLATQREPQFHHKDVIRILFQYPAVIIMLIFYFSLGYIDKYGQQWTWLSLFQWFSVAEFFTLLIS